MTLENGQGGNGDDDHDRKIDELIENFVPLTRERRHEIFDHAALEALGEDPNELTDEQIAQRVPWARMLFNRIFKRLGIVEEPNDQN